MQTRVAEAEEELIELPFQPQLQHNQRERDCSHRRWLEVIKRSGLKEAKRKKGLELECPATLHQKHQVGCWLEVMQAVISESWLQFGGSEEQLLQPALVCSRSGSDQQTLPALEAAAGRLQLSLRIQTHGQFPPALPLPRFLPLHSWFCLSLRRGQHQVLENPV